MTNTSRSIKYALQDAKKNSGKGQQRWRPPTQDEIKELRIASGLTQAKFAERYGFNLTSYRKWEQGRGKPEQVTSMVLQIIGTDPQATQQIIEKTKDRISEQI